MWFAIVGEIRDSEPIALGARCECEFGFTSSTAVFGGGSSKESPKSVFRMARVALPKYTGTSLTESGARPPLPE